MDKQAHQWLFEMERQGMSPIRARRKLLEFPAKICTQKAEVRSLREHAKAVEQQRSLLEAELISEISEELNLDTGKPLFSNDKARSAGLVKRKALSEDYQVADRAARQAHGELSSAQEQLEMLYDEFRSWRMVSDSLSSEMRLLAGDTVVEQTSSDAGEVTEAELAAAEEHQQQALPLDDSDY